jgi:cell wall assembly regulator SMI1
MGGKRSALKSSEAFRKLWQDHFDWTARTSRNHRRRMTKGASASRINAMERRLGVFLPDDLRHSWLAQNGTTGREWPTFGRILTITEIGEAFSRYAAWQGQLGWGLGEDYRPARCEGAIKAIHWSPLRIPVAEDGAGNGLMLDLDPDHGGSRGQVIEFRSLGGPTRVLASSWAEFLDQLFADSRDGRYPGAASGPWASSMLPPQSRPAVLVEKASRYIGEIPVEGDRLILSTEAEVDDLEEKLGHRTPAGYREYVTRLGDGDLRDLDLTVHTPHLILHRGGYYALSWRMRVAAYWFWDDNPDLITQASALRYTCIANTVDGHDMIVGPDDPDRILFLTIGNEGGSWDAGRGLPAAIEWLAGVEKYFNRGPLRAFEPALR